MTNILDATQRKFVQTKTISINPKDQPWVNSYISLLMQNKNRNNRILKRVKSEYFSSINRRGVYEELFKRLKY